MKTDYFLSSAFSSIEPYSGTFNGPKFFSYDIDIQKFTFLVSKNPAWKRFLTSVLFSIRLFDLSMGEARHVKNLLHLAVTSDIPLDSLKIMVAMLPTSAKTLEACLDNLLKEAIEKVK